jgi:hypothetical protein
MALFAASRSPTPPCCFDLLRFVCLFTRPGCSADRLRRRPDFNDILLVRLFDDFFDGLARLLDDFFDGLARLFTVVILYIYIFILLN